MGPSHGSKPDPDPVVDIVEPRPGGAWRGRPCSKLQRRKSPRLAIWRQWPASSSPGPHSRARSPGPPAGSCPCEPAGCARQPMARLQGGAC
jgi:hypothetical protein